MTALVNGIAATGNRGFHPVLEKELPYVFIDTCVQIWRDADAPNMHRHGVSAIAVTAWSPYAGVDQAMEGIMYWHLLARKHPNLVVVDTAEDVQRAKHDGRLALILVSQDGDFLGDKLHRLEAFHRLGLKMLIPAYNGTNLICDGCLDQTDTGLTRFGELVVSECNRLGVLLDCTHVGKRASLEILERSRQPVVFSHSNVKALVDNPRNIDDEQIRACVQKGGVVGVVSWGPMALKRGKRERPTLSDFVDHIDYIAQLAGSADSIGIGTDFSFGSYPAGRNDPWGHPIPVVDTVQVRGPYNRLPGMTNRTTSPERYVAGFSSYPEVVNVIEMLQQRGYGDQDIGKILGGNYLRVFTKVWREARA